MDILGLKSSQAAYINDPDLGVITQASDDSRIKQLARAYLDKHGVKIEPAEESVEQTINRIAEDVTDWKPFPNVTA